MSWDVQMAKMFKDRDNKAPEEATIAKVVNPMPDIKLSLGDDIILEEEDLIISSRIHELILHTGDDIIIIPSASGQLFYAMDKVGVKHVS